MGSRGTGQEIAIVGGGPAGLSTALFLANADPRATERIVVLEKARYPRDKICGGAIAARADDLLAGIGVQVDVPSAGVDGFSVQSRERLVCKRRGRIGRVVRRIEWDAELARIVRARGIRIEEDVDVRGIERDERGVTLETSRGRVQACAVVGADMIVY